MVKTTPQVIRVVLDTNVLVSALLFGGMLNRLVAKWKTIHVGFYCRMHSG